jgi:hypothetical protein
MATPDPHDVGKMLDELAQAQPQMPQGQPAQQVVDPHTVLEQATRPAPPPAQQPPLQPPAVDPEKFGRIINENAFMRQELDRLRLQVESLAQPMQPSVPQPPLNDGGWNAWSNRIVSEVNDETWLANPKEGVRVSLERGGRELATHVSNIATARAWEVGTAMQLDTDFSGQYPDLMATEMGQIAVRQAIGKVVGDQRFQNLMRNRATRPRALAVVAKLANQDLGRNTEVDPLLSALADQPPQRRTQYAERQGARPQAPGPVNPTSPERNEEAMASVIDWQRTHS